MASQVYFGCKWMLTQECVVCIEQKKELVVVGTLTKSPSHSGKTVIDKVAHQTVTLESGVHAAGRKGQRQQGG
jgi:hypothetical protein